MRRVVGRLQHLGMPLALLVLGVFAIFAGSNTLEITCERAQGECTYRRGYLGGRDTGTFPISEVREVRFVDELGKHNRYGQTVLVFRNGEETRIGYDQRAAAAERFEIARDFFRAGGTAPRFRYEKTKARWWWLVMAGCFVGAAVLGVRGWRQPVVETMPVRVPGVEVATRGTMRRKRLLKIGAAVVALAALSATLLIIGNLGKGTLALRCESRCRFEQMECMPGAETSMGLDPGTYTIEVWQRSGDALWLPRTFTITEGETTSVVCGP